jgi:outer membrane lipoprotein-sorting protein
MKRRHIALTATAGAVAGALGLTALTVPAAATRDPELPPIAPEQLVESVMTAAPPALSGTVEINNNLGMPEIPGLGQASGLLADGTSKLQVWTDGQGRQRVAVPSHNGEMTMINDGSTVWQWDSQKRTATQSPQRQEKPHKTPQLAPADAARQIVNTLRQSSNVAVDGTASVAGRDAYELVLTPKPTERTVLREARIAVDAEKRIPLSVEVNTNGSDQPALKAGFSELDLSQPDPSLFQFTPPAGTKVERKEHPEKDKAAHGAEPKIIGDGWDTVAVTRLPEQRLEQRPDEPNPRAFAERIGKKVSGPWGQGWIVTTKAGSALMTSDGRVAAGAVPEQVLTEAIGNA